MAYILYGCLCDVQLSQSVDGLPKDGRHDGHEEDIDTPPIEGLSAILQHDVKELEQSSTRRSRRLGKIAQGLPEAERREGIDPLEKTGEGVVGGDGLVRKVDMPQLAKIRLAGAADNQACGAANQSTYRKLDDVLAVCLTGFLFSGGAVFVKCWIFLALKLLSSVLPRQRGPPGGHRSTSSRRRGRGLG